MDESTNRYWGYVAASSSLGRWRSMHVSVLSNQGQRSLLSAVRTSVLGDGLLERTRSTSLALLGATAAIGLAIVALALNQGWPLIAGVPIPGFGSDRQAVGKAAVVARATVRGSRPAISAATAKTGLGISSGKPSRRSGNTAAVGGSRAPRTAGLVAAHPTPAGPAGEATTNPAPVAEQPGPAPAPAAVAAVPVSSSASTSPGSVSQGISEVPISSQGPPPSEENDTHDHGHQPGKGVGHGHSHGRQAGGGDSETPEPSQSSETPPAQTEAAPPESDQPGESESDQSHAPSGHGGGHGHGHGNW